MLTQAKLKPSSVPYWLAALIAIAIILIGIRGLVAPGIAAEGYGIPVQEVARLAFLRAKGIRDLVSGLFVIAFLLLGSRLAVALVIAIAILIPATDFLIVFSNGGDLLHLGIHGGTALYMVVVAALLLRSHFQTQSSQS